MTLPASQLPFPSLSIVLPCFNEASSLPALVADFHLALVRREIRQGDFELILVDNGSTDTTPGILKRMTQQPDYSFLKTIRLEKNLGYGGGIVKGLSVATGETLGYGHADLQCPAEDIFRGFDLYLVNPGSLIKGRRINRNVGPWAFSRSYEAFVFLLQRQYIHEINAQPKIFGRALLDGLLRNPPMDFAWDLHVCLRAKEAGLRLVEFDVKPPPRVHGRSHWAHSLRSRFSYSLKCIQYLRDYAPVAGLLLTLGLNSLADNDAERIREYSKKKVHALGATKSCTNSMGTTFQPGEKGYEACTSGLTPPAPPSRDSYPLSKQGMEIYNSKK